MVDIKWNGQADDVLTKDELAALQKKLSKMSTTALNDFYFAAYYQCRPQEQGFPAARSIQELMAAWKALRRNVYIRAGESNFRDAQTPGPDVH
jgi:hypothetical protein